MKAISTLLQILLLAPAGALVAQERYDVTGPRVAIYNLAGAVSVEPGQGRAVTVEVRRGGPDAGELSIERGPIGDRETLRVVYPGDAIRYRSALGTYSTDLYVRPDGTFGDGGRDWGRRAGQRVRISGRGGDIEAWADLTIRVPEGQQIEVYLGAGSLAATNVRGALHLDGASATISASGITGPLSVDVGSGDVTVRDVAGNVDLDTGSGTVDVSGVRGDVLRIDTGSGEATAADITATTVRIDTGSGDIELTGVAARDIALDTGSGAVRCTFTSNPDALDVDTGSGSVTLTLPASYGAAVDIESGSGGVELDFPVETRRLARGRVVGTIGDGRGTLKVDTGSGSVRIRRGQG